MLKSFVFSSEIYQVLHHEEADTRMLLNLGDAVKEGYTKVSICTVDTDVLVLAVTAAQRLDITELWVAF